MGWLPTWELLLKQEMSAGHNPATVKDFWLILPRDASHAGRSLPDRNPPFANTSDCKDYANSSSMSRVSQKPPRRRTCRRES